MELTGGKYLIKITFGIKIEIFILQILDVPNFNKFFNFGTNLGLTGDKDFIKFIADIIWAIIKAIYLKWFV